MVKQFLHQTPAHRHAVAALPSGAGYSINYLRDEADGIKQRPENGWFLPVRVLCVSAVSAAQVGGCWRDNCKGITVGLETGIGDPYVRRSSAKERVRGTIP